MLNFIRFLLILIGFAAPFQIFATTEHAPHVKASLYHEEETIQPGHPFWVALQLNLEDGWHVYWKNPGDAGRPLKIEWKLPEGFEAAPLEWPFPEKFSVADMVGFGYKKEVVLLAQITPPAYLDPSDKPSLEAKIEWLVCSSFTCQPGSTSITLPLTISSTPPNLRSEYKAFFIDARSKIPQSHVEIKTIRKHGMVQLEVPLNTPEFAEGAIREAYFFPEQKNVIDHSIGQTIAQSTTDSNQYYVNLKGSDDIGAEIQHLKGVLVVHKGIGKQTQVEAFDIDSPIEDDGSLKILSFLDHAGKASYPSIGHDSKVASSALSFEGGVGLAILFAFLGGMILNLMPCVLPVMSLKVMSFVKMAGQSRSLSLKHGLMFTFGVLLSFWVLASVMLIFRAYGQSVGWGFQLQEPIFVCVLATFLFIFSLSLFGVFEWGMIFASWAGQTQADAAKKKSGYFGSFFNGVLATAVATPCTGPFLGSAVGFAVTLPVWQSLLVFSSLGLGMAFPYLILAAFPACLRFVPKPGAWMETFKHLMGFLLLATVLWLLWVFSAQTDNFSLFCLLAGFLFLSIAAWIYGRGCTPEKSRKKQLFAYAFVILFAILGFEAILYPRATWSQQTQSLSKSPSDDWKGWEEFSPERLAQLRLEGKPVLIDFTAKWCLICQTNHLVLDSDSVKKELDQAGVIKMKADWTKNDPIITKELSKFGRNSVPLYVLYGNEEKQEPQILPQVLTVDVVKSHLEKAISTDDIALK